MRRLIAFVFIFLVGSVLCFGNVVQAAIDDDLIAYYPFNGNANDESGGGNDASLYDGAYILNGKAIFDGQNDCVISKNPISINSSALTLAVKFLWNGEDGLQTNDAFTLQKGNKCGIISMSNSPFAHLI